MKRSTLEHIKSRWKPFKTPFIFDYLDLQWVEWLWNWGIEYLAIRSSTCWFSRIAHSFTCSTLLAALMRPAAHIRLLTHSLAPELLERRPLFMIWKHRFHSFSTHREIGSRGILVNTIRSDPHSLPVNPDVCVITNLWSLFFLPALHPCAAMLTRRPKPTYIQ